MKTKKHFPFQVPRPKDMTVLDQVLCMVYLSQSCSLNELRKKQELVIQQLDYGYKHKKNCDDLGAMIDNLSAAVAYQAFPDEPVWMAFINEK